MGYMAKEELYEHGPSRWHMHYLRVTVVFLLAAGGMALLQPEPAGLLNLAAVAAFAVATLAQIALYIKLFHAYYADAKHLSEMDAPFQPEWQLWALFHLILAPIAATAYILHRDPRVKHYPDDVELYR